MSKAEEFKKQLQRLLPENIVRLQFTKADGSLRTIDATLIPEHIKTTTSEKPTKAANPDVQAVWDMENHGWRSFRYDSVVQILWLTKNPGPWMPVDLGIPPAEYLSAS